MPGPVLNKCISERRANIAFFSDELAPESGLRDQKASSQPRRAASLHFLPTHNNDIGRRRPSFKSPKVQNNDTHQVKKANAHHWGDWRRLSDEGWDLAGPLGAGSGRTQAS